MEQLLRNPLLSIGGVDWTAVRRYESHCDQAAAPGGGGRRRIWYTDDRAFWSGALAFSGCKHSVARDRRRPNRLGFSGSRWDSILDRRGSAHESAKRLPAGF